ncbi:MAG TPA: ATP synthase F0 subunit B [bacterium]|nr:ATP synthase F0 subunit B [bacterium]
MGFIDLGAFAIQFVNLLVIIYVLNRFLFRPYLAYIDREAADRARFESSVSDADKLVREAHAEAESLRLKARDEAASIRRDGEELAKREASEIVARAKADAESVRTKAVADLAADRSKMEQDLEREAIKFALDVNARLFARSEAHTDFITKQCQAK